VPARGSGAFMDGVTSSTAGVSDAASMIADVASRDAVDSFMAAASDADRLAVTSAAEAFPAAEAALAVEVASAAEVTSTVEAVPAAAVAPAVEAARVVGAAPAAADAGKFRP
jgi:hypothetical protein